MRTIYIEFTKPKKILPIYSWLIRAIEGTEYSHVRIRWKSSSGVELVYEAGGRSVRLIGSEAVDSHQVEVIKMYSFQVDKQQYSNLIRLFRFAGVDYGILQAVGILVAKIFNMKRNPFSRGRKSQVCSELVGIFLNEVVGIKESINLDLAGPKDIEDIIRRVLQGEIQ